MLRILLIISLVFSLSLFSNMSYVYAPCRPGHGDGGGDSGRSHSGGGGGMSGAAGAAAGLGLLFNLLQATRAQEDAGIDLDALATEYATAFHLMDPTVSLVNLFQPYLYGGTGVSIAVLPSEYMPGCTCGYDNCNCQAWYDCGGTYKGWPQEVELQERVCSGDDSEKPVCSCPGGHCICPREDACDAQIIRAGYLDLAQEWSGKMMDAPPGSKEARDAARRWNYYRKKAEEGPDECK